VYQAVQVAEQEFNLLLPNVAYLNVLRVCASDGSEPAANFAVRMIDGLKARTLCHACAHLAACRCDSCSSGCICRATQARRWWHVQATHQGPGRRALNFAALACRTGSVNNSELLDDAFT
jgi:hypothetical protein